MSVALRLICYFLLWLLLPGFALAGGFPMINSRQVATVFTTSPTAATFTNQSDGGLGHLSMLSSGIQGTNSLTQWVGDPVNRLTGDLTHDETDLSIKGRGLPILFASTTGPQCHALGRINGGVMK